MAMPDFIKKKIDAKAAKSGSASESTDSASESTDSASDSPAVAKKKANPFAQWAKKKAG